MEAFAHLAFTPSVRQVQSERGSRDAYARHEAVDPPPGLGEREAAFLSAADSLFLATVSETGWPYVQHRGGPPGFVKVLSPTRIAFADFRGNRQYVTVGNVQRENRVSLIVVDYPSRQRLKLLGRLQVSTLDEVDPALLAAVLLPDYRARMDGVATIEVEAFDWNCPQHITPRFTEAQIAVAVRPLHARIAELEAEVLRLREASKSSDPFSRGS
jgi:predicted pyridoxine 5'-phosphate oxidase superfamily flavin-nucleotide-binding protein